MTICWIIIRYDPQYTIAEPYIFGVYSTKKKAVNKILDLVEQEYNNCNKGTLIEFAETWFTDENSDELLQWEDFKNIIKKKFKINKNYCEGFVFNYKIMKKNFDN